MKKDKVNIGIEVHVQINTKTKLFCGCPTKNTKQNTNVCGVCLGFPGTKPSLNNAAVSKSILIALALDSKIQEKIAFSRKVYFYPDLSKNFQITQYEFPLARNGFLQIKNKKIPIYRINLEEDPASLQHESNYSLIDYNRSGIPLVEIVTEPSFNNSEEVLEFLSKLIGILDYLEIYDPKNFTIRIDVNVSIDKGNRVEIKNLTGFKDIEKAIDFEVIRQKIKLNKKMKIEQETVHYDSESEETFSSRSKEGEEDYGYIFEPDLPILYFDDTYINKLRKNIPELPHKRLERFKKVYDLNDEEARILTEERSMADLFENLSNKIDKDYLKGWMIVTLKKVLNYNNLKISNASLDKSKIYELLKMITNKNLTKRTGEFVLRELVNNPNSSVENIIEKLGLGEIKIDEITNITREVIRNNPKAILDYKNGTEKALEFLVGQVVRNSKGRADPNKVREFILKNI